MDYLAITLSKKKTLPKAACIHYHHASLLKIINKTGSLFRGLGSMHTANEISMKLFVCALSVSFDLFQS